MYVEKRKKTNHQFVPDTLYVCQCEPVCDAYDSPGGAGSDDAFLCGHGGVYRSGHL